MRKIILFVQVSVDGFFEGPDRELDWHRMDEELHTHVNDVLRGMGGFLSGRVNWELMAAFWPTADADPASPPWMREFAGIWREMPKLVFSRTLERAGWNTTVVRQVDAAEIGNLKAQPGGDLVLGAANLAATFLRQGLVDEIRLYVHPVVLGRGRPLFQDEETKLDLRLEETRTFSNGVVLLRYRVGGAA